MSTHEQKFFQAVFQDETWIDKSVQQGLTADHFTDHRYRKLWAMLLELRLSGAGCDFASVYAHAHKSGKLADLGGPEALMEASAFDGTTLGASGMLASILTSHARREAWKKLRTASELLESESASLAEVGSLVESVVGICAGKQTTSRGISDINQEVDREIEAAKTGKLDDSKWVKWGLPRCDKYLGAFQPNEYALLCARPSVGKSSMCCHLAGVNLKRGLKIAYFPLETTDTEVLVQIACQWCNLNWSERHRWFPDDYKRFKDARTYIQDSKRLLIFDDDMTLEGVSAKMRMLATSYGPDLVCLDYLGNLVTEGKNQYERVTRCSNSMVPLRKILNCTLIAAHQLSRPDNATKAEPTLAALRDSGHLEQDAARVNIIHWQDSHILDLAVREYKILQPKYRGGAVTAVDGIQFHAPTRSFKERAT